MECRDEVLVFYQNLRSIWLLFSTKFLLLVILCINLYTMVFMQDNYCFTCGEWNFSKMMQSSKILCPRLQMLWSSSKAVKLECSRHITYIKVTLLRFEKYLNRKTEFGIALLTKNQTYLWNPPPGRWGDNFVRPWETLNFHLPLGGLAKWGGGVKILHTFGGMTTGFSLLGDGGSPSPTGQKSLKNYSPHKRFILPPTH